MATRRPTKDKNGNARTAQQKRDGAARARLWREETKQQGKPLPRDVDAAVTETLSFLLARNKRDGVNIGTLASIDPAEIALGAKFVLERQGFDPVLAGKMIKRRLEPRDDHRLPLYVPSLRPGDPELIPSPQGRDGWSARIDQVVRFFDGPHAVTPPK
jgi:hypothetical protein